MGDGQQTQPVATIPVEKVKPTPDQAERRERSEAYCKAHNVPVYVNPTAFFTDPEDSVTIRSKDEVVDRALALRYIALKGDSLDQSSLDQMSLDFDIPPKLSPKERDYALSRHPTHQQTIDAFWRYESLHVMLWALGFVDSLRYPDSAWVVVPDLKPLMPLTEAEFRAKARLRSKREILGAADLILRLHWACVDAQTHQQSAPGHLLDDVVSERHYALNWLIRYMDQDWDNVTTDT